jgi:hypothetical protein
MDVEWLRARLDPRTTLVLGDVRETAPGFYDKYDPPPLGFVVIDLDLYSSTVAALQMLASPNRRMSIHKSIYFDDIYMHGYHRFAGELLAIDEFNRGDAGVKIDSWRGLLRDRWMRDRVWPTRMYMTHALDAINRVTPLVKPPAIL